MTGGGGSWSARMPVAIGLLAIVVLVAGLGGWAVGTRIEGAIIAPGKVRVESFRQVVQHQDGGTVALLGVREGDRVEAGDLLLRLDDAELLSQRAILAGQLHELLARSARLRAERDDAARPRFAPELVEAAAGDARLGDLMASQLRLFETRRAALGQQVDQLEEKIRQLHSQIAGLQAQGHAVERQLTLVRTELANQEELLGKGLARLSGVLALRREEARLSGQAGDLEARIAQTSGQIAEARLEILRLGNARREDAITALRDTAATIGELRERIMALDTRLARLEIRAPVSGVVHGLAVHTPRAVVRPAEPILSIVPDTSRLIVEVRIPTVHIDEVHPGQPVTLRFPSFDLRRTPVVEGRVTRVSADAFTDDATRATYYKGEVAPDPQSLAALHGAELIPGMPVEAFIRTGARTPLSYFIKPLTDYFGRAFREG
ncbi:MAG: HlyD family type I secretion periplasmic adaptor subunit [Alphaproteobacteria bacterium]|nr:MAG: HlyD family type I secretion periplasmic adaptor subunit [Alphaproteobacteria bacterium]